MNEEILFSACRSLPCSLERATCKAQNTSYTCECRAPYSGPPSSHGQNCTKYVIAIHPQYHLRPNVVIDTNMTIERTFENCKARCTQSSCLMVSYGGNSICQVFSTLPRALVTDEFGFTLAVREVCLSCHCSCRFCNTRFRETGDSKARLKKSTTYLTVSYTRHPCCSHTRTCVRCMPVSSCATPIPTALALFTSCIRIATVLD